MTKFFRSTATAAILVLGAATALAQGGGAGGGAAGGAGGGAGGGA